MGDFPRLVTQRTNPSVRRMANTQCETQPVHVQTYPLDSRQKDYAVKEKVHEKCKVEETSKATTHHENHHNCPTEPTVTPAACADKSAVGIGMIIWIIILFIIILIIVMAIFWFITPEFCSKVCDKTGKSTLDLSKAAMWAFFITFILVFIIAVCWCAMKR